MSSLQDRIESAIDRITSGHALMRVPVDETDPDTVLRDCQTRIAELEAERDRLREAGVGYSQQTVDAITKEREALRARVAELEAERKRHLRIMGWLLDHYDGMRCEANRYRREAGHAEFVEEHGAKKARQALAGKQPQEGE